MAAATQHTAIPAIMDTITTAEGPGAPALLRLLAWTSASCPTGGFSYSHGLERAVHERRIADVDALQAWIAQLLEFGSGWNDAVLLAAAWRRATEPAALQAIAERAEALCGSLERHRESLLQGTAFHAAARAWGKDLPGGLPASCAYPVAFGAGVAAHGVPLMPALSAYLQVFASNLLQAGIRLGVTGQSGALTALARLETVMLATVVRAEASTLDSLGTATLLAEIIAMRHETQATRLFRS